MAETLDYRHVAHLIAGFGSAESYTFVCQIHVRRLKVDYYVLTFHEGVIIAELSSSTES